MLCKICNKELKSIKALSQHIRFHNISSKDYFDKYLLITGGNKCQTCGNETKFKNLSSGYQTFCNLICSNNNSIVKRKIGIKQKISWKTRDKNKVQVKISNSLKKQWNDQHSLYNQKHYRDKLKLSKKRINVEKREIFIKNEILNNSDFTLIDYSLYHNAHSECLFQCKKCNKTFKTLWNYIQQGKQCPYCGKNISNPEIEILEFLQTFNLNIIHKARKIIPPKELDIFFPDLKIAIEFNGLYWHSEQNIKDHYYHLNKTELCNNQNIHLIQIFEDEWMFKKEIVKQKLKSILNIFDDKKSLNLNDCEIKEIDSETKNKFLEKFDIKGSCFSDVNIGLFYQTKLVSVMTFLKHQKDTWELNRFCIDYNYYLPEASMNLLSYFQKTFTWKKIFSYDDLRWSNGNLFYTLGFQLVEKTKPNYWFLSNYKRLDINNNQKNLFKIWDCGSLKFELNSSTI